MTFPPISVIGRRHYPILRSLHAYSTRSTRTSHVFARTPHNSTNILILLSPTPGPQRAATTQYELDTHAQMPLRVIAGNSGQRTREERGTELPARAGALRRREREPLLQITGLLPRAAWSQRPLRFRGRFTRQGNLDRERAKGGQSVLVRKGREVDSRGKSKADPARAHRQEVQAGASIFSTERAACFLYYPQTRNLTHAGQQVGRETIREMRLYITG